MKFISLKGFGGGLSKKAVTKMKKHRTNVVITISRQPSSSNAAEVLFKYGNVQSSVSAPTTIDGGSAAISLLDCNEKQVPK